MGVRVAISEILVSLMHFCVLQLKYFGKRSTTPVYEEANQGEFGTSKKDTMESFYIYVYKPYRTGEDTYVPQYLRIRFPEGKYQIQFII